ncbi:MAG: AbrB/MazE/SpoVT family DNA-binding domain-containing protein [Candidatus Woesearchaeota archaeon]
MVKIQFINNKQYKITLPKQIVDAKGWKKGDTLVVKINEKGEIVLTR